MRRQFIFPPSDVLMRERYDFLYSLLPEITAEQQAEKDALFAEPDRLKDMGSMAETDTVAGFITGNY